MNTLIVKKMSSNMDNLECKPSAMQIDDSKEIIDLTEEKEMVPINPYEYTCLKEYMGVSIDEWIEYVNSSVSYKVRKIGVYSKAVYATAIDAIISYLSRDQQSFKTDMSKFMSKQLNPDVYLNVIHSKLTDNYISYKNYCLKYKVKNKALNNDRNDWYTTNAEFLDEELKVQYLEIVFAVLTNVSNIMMCSCMQQMNLG